MPTGSRARDCPARSGRRRCPMLDCAKTRGGEGRCGCCRVGSRRDGLWFLSLEGGWAKTVGDWRQEARHELLRLRGTEPAWGYRERGGRSRADGAGMPRVARGPCCVRLDSGFGTGAVAKGASDGAVTVIAACSDWLAKSQRPDGTLGLRSTQPVPGWTTSLGLLLWQAAGSHERQRRRAVEWLLSQEGDACLRRTTPTTLSDTTRSGRLALGSRDRLVARTDGLGSAWRCVSRGWTRDPRVVEGYRLIRDCAIVTGGVELRQQVGVRVPAAAPAFATGLHDLPLRPVTTGRPSSRGGIRICAKTLPNCPSVRLAGLGVARFAGVVERRTRPMTGWPRPNVRATGRPDAAAKLILALDCRRLAIAKLFE